MPPKLISLALDNRWPQDPDELHEFVHTVFGMNIPRKSVCKNHCAPFDAFCNAYFADSPVAIWKASRGLGGKSTMLATLCATESVCLGAQVTILGGSGAQSARVHEVQTELWEQPFAPSHMLAKDNMLHTRLTNGGWIRALMASQRSARGPHPQRLRLDEIDEMDESILEAAQGQPMDAFRNGTLVRTHTVMSSTHQYPDKTMTSQLKRAAEKNWPVYEWCYRESMGTASHPGWLTESAVERKRAEIPSHMWDIEYDLQEPSITGRVLDVEFVDAMWDSSLGTFLGGESEKLIFEKPVQGAHYVTGVDWAKEQDWTIVATYNASSRPWKLAAWTRIGRLPWPIMVHHVEKRLDMYGGILVHDSTGVGNVVNDFLQYDTNKVYPFVMVGRAREECFNDYIAAIEARELTGPRVEFAHSEHKYVTAEDLYTSKGHPPDSFVAGALAWTQRNARSAIIRPGSVERDGSSPWRD